MPEGISLHHTVIQGPEAIHRTEKFVPSFHNGRIGSALMPTCESELCIVSWRSENDPIGPVLPETVAWQLVKYTTSKFASGKTPEELLGASTTHSADDLAAADAIVELYDV